MNRDDYISKLFIKNQSKLDQAPSADLWSKLEAQLDEKKPVVQTVPGTSGARVLSMSKYLAAASIFLVLMASVYWFQELRTASPQLAIEPAAGGLGTLLTDNAEPYEDAEVVPTNVKIRIGETEEIRKQEAKIIKENNKAKGKKLPIILDSNDKIELQDITIIEKVNQPAGSIISIEPEVTMSSAAKSSGQNSELHPNNSPVEQRNYSGFIPQISNSVDNNIYADEVLSKSRNDNSSEKKSSRSAEVERKIAPRGGLVPSQSKESDIVKVKSPMAAAHARLQPFGFLIGKWVDDYEKEGISYEIWSLKDPNTIIGKGFKMSKSNERIFEESMRIQFRDNQVFLVISLDESISVEYMLTKFDTERFIFEQRESSKYPDRVVLQRNLDGYQTIILNDSNFLTSDQQRFLANRNRVSNVRSIRTMRYSD